jgi:uncharacterized protein involved in exopolysaccharide biosynthesis
VTPASEPDLTLSDVLRRLARRRTSLIAFPLAVGAVAALASLALPDLYLPEAIVSIEQPRRRQGEPLVPLDTLVQNHRYLLRSANLQQPVLTALASSEGVTFTVREFSDRIRDRVPRESQFLFLGFLHEDPVVAARAANALATALVESVNAFNRGEVSRFLSRYGDDIAAAEAEVATTREALVVFQRENQLELLEDQISVASGRRSELESELRAVELQRALQGADPVGQTLEQAEDERLALQTETEIEVLRSRRTSLLSQQARFETDLATTRVDLAARRDRLLRLEVDLADQSAVTPVRRAIDDQPALQQALAAAGGVDVSALLSVSLTAEELNPVHASVANEVIRERADVEALARRETELLARLETLDQELSQLEEAIHRGELGLERMDRTVTLTDAEYRRLHETSPVGLETKAAQLMAEITALSGEIESMRSRHNAQSAQMRTLSAEWDLAHGRLQAYSTEIDTATLSVLEQMPTLAVFSAAPVPSEPEPKNRARVLAAGLILGLALALGRAYLLEFSE